MTHLISKLVVIVIDSGSNRSRPLLKLLSNSSRIELILLKASMISSEEDLKKSRIQYDQILARKFTGRSLTFPEIGCSDSHNRARAILASLPFGGVILEDDGRICNFEEFVNISEQFLKKFTKKPALLNLSNLNPLFVEENIGNTSRTFYCRTLGPTPLAVGYVVTSLAANLLLKNNSPISSVADWPALGLSCYTPSHQFVHHGDELTQSTIDPNNLMRRNKRSISKFLFVLSGFHYALNFKEYPPKLNYFQRIWLPRLTSRLSFLKGPKNYV